MSPRIPLAMYLSLALCPIFAFADAQGDLAAGKAALDKGNAQVALPLLKAAAEGLPQSVDAQLALGECHLRLGSLDDALQQYRAVAKLSRDHARAKQMIAALTGQRTSFARMLATARTLMQSQEFSEASSLISHALRLPHGPEQVDDAALLLAEASLWGASTQALPEAIKLVQSSGDAKIVSRAKVVASLAMLLNDQPGRIAQADQFLQGIGELDATWQGRANIARATIAMSRQGDPLAISNQFASISAIPHCSFRTGIRSRAEEHLVSAAQAKLKKGDTAGALAIVWPMVSNQKQLPKAGDLLKEITIANGWLVNTQSNNSATIRMVIQLTSIGQTEFQRSPNAASSLLGYWLAAELFESTTQPTDTTYTGWISLASDLKKLSHVSKGRKAGQPLSHADEVQRAILLKLAAQPLSPAVLKRLVDEITAHIDRYGKAGDLATGLAQFANVKADAKSLQVELASPLDSLAIGVGHQHLVNGLVARFAAAGRAAFNTAQSAVLLKAVDALNTYDAAALALHGKWTANYALPEAITSKVINRYANANQWSAAAEAYALLHTADVEAGQWAVVELRVRQATAIEDQLLSARRALGAELGAGLKLQLAGIVKLVDAEDSDRNQQRAAVIADGLIQRYIQLSRPDLADAVVDAIAGKNGAKSLAAWSLWTRANLLERKAAMALAEVARNTDDRGKLALNPNHKAELLLLDTLIKSHTTSKYAVQSVGRVRQIAQNYRSYRAYDTSTSVLASFLKTHANLAAAEQVEYEIIQVALSKAQYGFDNRESKTPPAALSAEYSAAIDGLAKFLTDHPTSELAVKAEEDLFTIGRIHGDAGAWNVTRDVLKRFTAAIPNFRSPSYLKYLESVTYLGELDPKYALSLLSPNPIEPKVSLPYGSTTIAADRDYSMTTIAGGVVYENGPSDAAKELPVAEPKPPKLPPPGEPAPGGFGGGGGFTYSNTYRAPAEPSASSLAMIRQSQQRQFQRIAMLEKAEGKDLNVANQEGDVGQVSGVALPSGSLLSDAEMKRQDDAADKAYALLIALVKNANPRDAAVSSRSREQMMWLFGFFEGQMRADRTVAFINRYLTDHPTDAEALALGYRALTDRLAWIGQQQPTTADQSWINERHAQFQTARQEIAAFIAKNADEKTWAHTARMLIVTSFQNEAQLVQAASPRRAGGLLVQAANALMSLRRSAPDHPEAANFPTRLYNIASLLANQQQTEAAVGVLRKIAVKYPTHGLANQSLARIAQLYATNLADPLRAVQAYQEYLSKTNGDPSVPTAIFSIADQLAGQQRYLEALHVYGVFVDSFPSDKRAAAALHAIGKTHQANGIWTEALAAYDRVFEEYPTA